MRLESHLKVGQKVVVQHPYVPGTPVKGEISGEYDYEMGYPISIPRGTEGMPAGGNHGNFHYLDHEVQVMNEASNGIKAADEIECPGCGSLALYSKFGNSCTNFECPDYESTVINRLIRDPDEDIYTEEYYQELGLTDNPMKYSPRVTGAPRRAVKRREKDSRKKSNAADAFLEPPDEEEIKRELAQHVAHIPPLISKARRVLDLHGDQLPDQGGALSNALDNIIAQVDSLKGMLREADDDLDDDLYSHILRGSSY